MVGVSLGTAINNQVKFDALVQQLLEYWDRQYSDAGNIVQLPKVPEVSTTLMSGDMFCTQCNKRKRKRKKQHREST